MLMQEGGSNFRKQTHPKHADAILERSLIENSLDEILFFGGILVHMFDLLLRD